MNPYSVLGVQENATPDEIKNAYRKLASKHHPDRGGDTKKFQEIQQAYDILTDENKRNEYYRSQNAENFNFSQSFGRNPFEDLINQFTKATKQNIYTVTVFVTLEQIAHGSNESIHINTPQGPKLIQIQVPQGIEDGTQVRYDGLVPNNWLQILFRIHRHQKFERSNLDLQMIYEVNIFDLIIGSKIVITDIFNKQIEVNIPPNTKPGSKFRISKHGLARSGITGDLYVLITPVIPDKISTELLNLIKLEMKGQA